MAVKKTVSKMAGKKPAFKGFVEKSTKERYASKAAMKKHEKKETVSERKKEYGKSYKRGMR